MGWNVEYTDEFGAWYEGLEVAVQDDIEYIKELRKEGLLP